ncbi:hypothetical protein EBZ38_06500 [bacterium]|nr:hypothetical protein [bacterium]
MAKEPKYTSAMTAVIKEVSDANEGLDLSLCEAIAERPEFVAAEISARGVVAKARTMGLPYRKAEKVTKSGEPVLRKEELVLAIERSLNLQGLQSLAKADKQALRTLAAALA